MPRAGSSRRSTGPKVAAQQVVARRRRHEQGDRREWRPHRRRHAASHRSQGPQPRRRARPTSPMKRARPSCARSRPRSAASASTPSCKGWFDRHMFQPVTSAIFLADLREHLVKGDKALEQKLELDQLGLSARHSRQHRSSPIPRPSPRSTRPSRPSQAGAQPTPTAVAALDDRRAAALPQPAAAQAAEGAAGRARSRPSASTSAGNNEVRFAWLDLAVAQPLRSGGPALEQFLTIQGRAQVRQAVVQRAGQGQAVGPADRGAGLRQGAAALSSGDAPRDLDKLRLVRIEDSAQAL